jgi:hypothetical protein
MSIMNRNETKACRRHNIDRLAQLGGVSERTATNLYNRCVRYCLRYFRWGEEQANGSGHYSKWQWEAHEHEGELLKALGKRLGDELKDYGLEWEYPGLYPVLVDERGNHAVELLWY